MRVLNEMFGVKPRPTNKELEKYRRQLEKAGLPSEDVERAVQAHPSNKVEERPLINTGLRVSTKGFLAIKAAKEAGVDTDPYLIDAAKVAEIAGRRKIGPFGQMTQVFSRLEHAVRQEQRSAAMRNFRK